MLVKIRYAPHISENYLSNLYYQVRHGKYSWWEVETRDKFDNWADVILDTARDYFIRPLNRFMRKIWLKDKIRIDDEDTWNLDSTLSRIMLPALIRLKELKHGSPVVAPEDVPDDLKAADCHAQWDFIMSEMIWAFEQLNDENCDVQFYHNRGQLETSCEPLPSGGSKMIFNRQKDPSKPKYYIDREGLDAHWRRVDRGLVFFGKYYRSLWD